MKERDEFNKGTLTRKKEETVQQAKRENKIYIADKTTHKM